jgi:hypothetical protein
MLQVLHRFRILFHYLLSLLLVFLQKQDVAKATIIPQLKSMSFWKHRVENLRSMGFLKGKKDQVLTMIRQ